MFKRIFISLYTVSLCLTMFAQQEESLESKDSIQQEECYELTNPGARVLYANYAGKMFQYYFEKTVEEVKEENGAKRIQYLWRGLNKNKKPSKYFNMMGLGEGYITMVKIENGDYYMTYDFGWSCFPGDRSGYLLKIPQNLKVGDELEGGTLKFVSKGGFGKTFNDNELSCVDFKVVDECELDTKAGKIRCLKITGKIVGTCNTLNVNSTETYYIAKNIGIVRQENSIGTTIEAVEIDYGVKP